MNSLKKQPNKSLILNSLEQRYLRSKSLFVSAMLFIVMFPVLIVLRLYDIPWTDILAYFLTFIILIAINLLFFFYKHHFKSMQLPMYITSVGLYLIMFGVIIDIYTSSIFTILFLAYAIIALYQDLKLSIFNSFLIFLSGVSLVLFYPDMFDTNQTLLLTLDTFYIMTFFIVFIALILTSSIIILKRKRYSYRQLAEIKEQEQKHISLLFELQSKQSDKSFDSRNYYDDLKSFSQSLSENIGINHKVFLERLEIIMKLEDKSENEVSEEYQNYTLEEIEELKHLELSVYNKISKTAFKAAQLEDINIDKKELLYERAQEKLNYRDDDKQVKLIAFVVFYTLLRLDKFYAKGLSHNQIMHILMANRYNSFIDQEVLDIFINNQSKIKKIVNDCLTGGVSS